VLQITFDDGETIYGTDILDSTIPEVYRRKMELIKMCGIDDESAKLVVLFPSAFPSYTKYLGGNYVAS